MVGAGHNDLVTPLGPAEYVIAHADFPAAATKLHLYPSGHMPFLGNDARRMLSAMFARSSPGTMLANSRSARFSVSG